MCWGTELFESFLSVRVTSVRRNETMMSVCPYIVVDQEQEV